ncbi:MAG: hypothetical protein HN509_17500 [Halobacteriovoraceae bacterium]|jgi:hypothetical protein|nr:hypothetical protein [Halobacteriovoraceae bacterium]MBT5093991.1 hypothetical protein [Halobacteriovoraceae bacterium]
MAIPRWLKNNAPLLLILAVASFLVFFNLDVGPHSRNEVLSIGTSKMPWWSYWPGLENHLYNAPDQQPLYFLLLKGWIGLGLKSQYALRSLSAIFYIFGVVLFYFFSKKIRGTSLAFWASLLFCTNFFLIDYGRYIRFYSLYLLFATGSWYFFVEFLKDHDRRNFGQWGLFTLFGLGTSIFMAVVLAIQLFLLILYRRKGFFEFLRTNAFLGSSFLIPLLLLSAGKGFYALYFRVADRGFNLAARRSELWQSDGPWGFFRLFSINYNTEQFNIFLVIGFIVIFLYGLFLIRSFNRALFKTCLVAFLLSYLLHLTFRIIIPLEEFEIRYFIFILPLFYISLGFVLDSCKWFTKIPILLFLLFPQTQQLRNFYIDDFGTDFDSVVEVLKNKRDGIKLFVDERWAYDVYVENLSLHKYQKKVLNVFNIDSPEAKKIKFDEEVWVFEVYPKENHFKSTEKEKMNKEFLNSLQVIEEIPIRGGQISSGLLLIKGRWKSLVDSMDGKAKTLE